MRWMIAAGCFLAAGASIILCIYGALYIAGAIYDQTHPLSVGEDDLGGGGVILFVAIATLAIAAPAMAVIFGRLYKFIVKGLKNNE